MSLQTTNQRAHRNKDNDNDNHTHRSPTLDNIHWIGDTFTSDKPTNTIRLAFQNLNGLGTNQYQQQLSLIAHEQISLDIDILGMTEHCVNVFHHDTLKNLHQAIKQTTNEKTSLQINSSASQINQRYLPGGTATLLVGNTVGRVEPNGKGGDSLGRWSYVHLRRKQLKPVTIITIYQVNKQPTNAIGNTAWHQQRLALDAHGHHDTHPRTAFINDLITFINSLRQQDHDLIIGGDFNDTISRNNSGILKLIMQTGLVDIWQHRHPSHQPFNTYARGSERIDTALCSPTLLPHIKGIGYSPFQWLTNSDHRAILIDADFNRLFNDDSPLSRLDPSSRHIRSNDSNRCKIFIDQFYNHLMSNNAERQLQTIQDDTATTFDVEQFDALIGQAGDSAEKHCKRRRPEFYSVTLNQLRIKKSIVHCHYRNLKQQRTSQLSILQERLQRANIQLVLPPDEASTKDLLNSIKQELTAATDDSFELRENELRNKINQKHAPGSEAYVTRLRAIKKSEATRKAWQTLNFLKNGSDTHQSLNRIDIPATWPAPHDQHDTQDIQDPKTCTSWRTVTNPDEIDHFIRMRNRGHFGQAKGTPFTELPLSESINWAADTSTAEDILRGHSQLDDIQSIPQCQALLDACQAASQLDSLPAYITPDEFKGKLKVWREMTTTSPSGRHLGRYKSLLTKLDKPDEQTGYITTEYRQKQSFIIHSIVSIINYCIRHNHILNRWRTIINTMIFKETGNYKIHRLRVIHIYEADFNLLLAVKWRQLLQHANLHGYLNNGLFGGRPGCEAQSLVFLEELKYDTSYCSRRTLFNFDNDATSCYDRIIIALASIVNRKYGLHKRLVALHANTLKQARFHLRTINGISTESYTHCLQFPIYGSGQGSGNSPAIWLFISSTLCDIHNQISRGAFFTNPQGTETVKLSMVAFVDDSTGTYNDFQPQTQPPIHEMLPHAQTDCQSWNDLLWCSGGKLELPKCSYHVLRFEFLPNGTPYPKKTADDLQLLVKDAETGDMVQIPLKQPDDPHKTLGHWKAPIALRHNQKQLSVLKDKAKDIALLIATGALSRHGANLAYHAVYCASLKFVLPQCFFPPRVLDQAEAKTLPIILAKQGFNRHTAKPIRFCPKSYGGCGMIPWKVLQGEGQITLFIKHWRTDTIISKMLRMTLAWAQWIAGTSSPILQSPKTPLPHLEARWIASLRQSLTDANMHVTIHDPFIVQPERLGDVHLMDWILNSKRYDNKQIRILNCCRIFLHITTISELTDASGKMIQPHMFLCQRPKWFNHNQYMPIQPRPSHHQIRTLWKPMCKLILQDITNEQINLKNWTGIDTSKRPFRPSYSETIGDIQNHYHWIQDAFWILKPYVENSQTSFLADKATEWTPTDISLPITITNERITIHGIVLRKRLATGGLEVPVAPRLTQSINRKDEYETRIQTLTQWQKLLLTNTKLHIEPDQIRHSMQTTNHTNWTMLTDYQFLNDKTCFSWILTQADGTCVATGSGPCPGPPERTRADAWSILAGTQFIHQLWQTTSAETRQSIRITICNRNQRIIKRIQDLLTYTTTYCNSTLDRDWDILKQIADTILSYQYSNIKWEPMKTFLASHTGINIQQLPTWTQRLIDTKQIAVDAYANVHNQQQHSPFLPASRCMLHHTSSTIHGRYNSAYRDAATLPALFAYLRRKNSWTDTTSKNIQWTWFKKAIRYPRESSNVAITKLVYNHLATQPRKATSGGYQWVDSQCPHCTDTLATFHHILRCKAPTAIACREKMKTTIETICNQRRAPNILKQTLHDWITTWLKNDTPTRTNQDQRLLALYDAQAAIGWDLMTRGFFAAEWSTITATFHPHREKPYNHDLLFPKLISELWKQQLEFWRQYQEARHSTPIHHNDITAPHAELQAQVRYLYTFHEQVVQTQRQHLFPPDLEHFLESTTTAQLNNYVMQYTSAIRLSVRQATRRSQSHTRSLVSYGFTTTTTNPPNQPAIHLPNETNVIQTEANPEGNIDAIQPPTPQPRFLQRLLTWARTRTRTIPLPTNRLTSQASTIQDDPPTPTELSHILPPRITRAPHHKHSRWRPTDHQKQRFLSYFRR
jgi:hypothetical protein